MKKSKQNHSKKFSSKLLMPFIAAAVAAAIGIGAFAASDSDGTKVKYAVSVYGIDHNLDKEDGNQYAHTITFGPAQGNYVTSYKDHTPSGTTDDGNAKRCIHADDWSTIIEWSKKDPQVYSDCLTNGCTKTVELSINDTLISDKDTVSTYYDNETGDGPGQLVFEVNDQWRVWNPQANYSGASSDEQSNGTNKGGWPMSRVRAVLNGSEVLDGNYTYADGALKGNTRGTYQSEDNGSFYGFNFSHWTSNSINSVSNITSSNCLLSCFPSELRSAILPKAVENSRDTANTSDSTQTTYDKLWLMSYTEMGHGSGYGGSTYAARSGSVDYQYYAYSGGSSSGNNGTGVWLRSPNPKQDSAQGVWRSYGNNSYNSTIQSSDKGLAPGFVLGGDPDDTEHPSTGSTERRAMYNAKNEVISGHQPTDSEMQRDGYKFMGWATTKEKADAGIVDFDPTPNDVTNEQMNAIGNGEVKRVYAVWKEIVVDNRTNVEKYAVMIYGIGQDKVLADDGVTEVDGGLTFGPATGDNFTSKYNSHTPTGTTVSGNAHRCIHDDDWSTIIENNEKDPYIYEQCLANECTKSVELKTDDSLKSVLFTGTSVMYNTDGSDKLSGDGVGILYGILDDPDATDTSYAFGDKPNYRYRNRQWNQNYSSTMNYAGSRIRAILNGYQSGVTDDTRAGTSSVKNYTADTCLLSAFPKELQDAIGKKVVHYATSYQAYTSDNVVYDKLWLFSNQELYGTSISSYNSGYYNYSNEGSQYQRLANANVTTSNYNKLAGYRNASYAYWWWLRSLYGNYNNGASLVNSSGHLNDNLVYDYSGVAPGFVLSR